MTTATLLLNVAGLLHSVMEERMALCCALNLNCTPSQQKQALLIWPLLTNPTFPASSYCTCCCNYYNHSLAVQVCWFSDQFDRLARHVSTIHICATAG